MESKKNLLIVDDEVTMRTLLWGVFEEQEDILVTLAKDGDEAIRILQVEKPDLVLLDVMMPGANGFQVCRHLRSLYGKKSVYVIIFTGLAGAEAEAEAYSAGADLFLNKPFDLRQLREIVRKNL